MITILIADSSLTLIPESIKKIIKGRELENYYIKFYGRFFDIFDVSVLPAGRRGTVRDPRYGRPDIVHRTILSVTDHPLFKSGIVRLYMHTLDGKVFKFSSGVRPPRNYVRFLGLMSQLLRRGWVGPSMDRPLIQEVSTPVSKLVEDKEIVILLDERGRLVDPLSFLAPLKDIDSTFIIGGFPEGDFSKEILEMADIRLSLYEESLSSSTIASMLLTYLYYLYRW